MSLSSALTSSPLIVHVESSMGSWLVTRSPQPRGDTRTPAVPVRRVGPHRAAFPRVPFLPVPFLATLLDAERVLPAPVDAALPTRVEAGLLAGPDAALLAAADAALLAGADAVLPVDAALLAGGVSRLGPLPSALLLTGAAAGASAGALSAGGVREVRPFFAVFAAAAEAASAAAAAAVAASAVATTGVLGAALALRFAGAAPPALALVAR